MVVQLDISMDYLFELTNDCESNKHSNLTAPTTKIVQVAENLKICEVTANVVIDVIKSVESAIRNKV